MEEVTMHRANEVLVKAVVTFVFLVGFAIPVSAQTVTAYEGARLIVGDGRVIENATLVVEGTRIAQVGSAADVRVPAGATRLSLAGKTLMPMIVDTHAHLSTTHDGLIRDLKQRAYFGVSGALSLGLDSFELLAMRNELIPGAARYFSAGKGITRIEPGRATFQINSEAEARKAVQENAAHRADIIKVWVDEREGKVEKVTPAQYAAIIDEAHNRGLRVTAHIFHMDDAKGLMRAGLDAFAHGVRDKDIDEEMEDMVLAGMTPMQVIVAATRNSAGFVRMTDAGTLEAGMSADFIVLDANPLDNITNTRRISSVILRGAPVDHAQPVR